MTILKTAGSLAAVAAVALVAGSASAAPTVTQNDCAKKGKEITTQLNEQSDSAALTEARRERMLGYSFCQTGNYAIGVAHFAKAAELIGQKQASR